MKVIPLMFLTAAICCSCVSKSGKRISNKKQTEIGDSIAWKEIGNLRGEKIVPRIKYIGITAIDINGNGNIEKGEILHVDSVAVTSIFEGCGNEIQKIK